MKIEIPKIKFRLMLLTCALLITMLTLIIGCKDSDPHRENSSTLPGREILDESNIAKFINNLDSLPLHQRFAVVKDFISNNPASPIIEGDNVAIFYWFGSASSVLINGDLQNGWNVPDTLHSVDCGKENFFYRIYPVPTDARLDYLFVIDGQTLTDPRNPITTPSGYGLHSQLAMPGFLPDTVRKIFPYVPKGIIEERTFESNLPSFKSRKIKIYTPSGYDTLANLPVIFVNDGFKAMEFCSYTTIIDNLIAEKKIKPLIAIFIDYIEGDVDYFLNKTEEYSSAICDELIPLIEKNYRVSNLPEDRVISGISAGGHISLLTALKRPEVFLNAAGQSVTTTKKLFNIAKEVSANSNLQEFKFYFDVGRYDLISGSSHGSFLYSNQLLHKQMTKSGLNHTFKVVNDGHQWASWRERTDDILIYFFGWNNDDL